MREQGFLREGQALKKEKMPDGKSVFAIYLLEQDGTVKACADYVGEGQACLDIGLELIASLSVLSVESEGAVTISPRITSSSRH